MGDSDTPQSDIDALVTDRLRDWGWTDERTAELRALGDEARVPARVIAQHRGEYRLMGPWGEVTGVVPGRMLHRASGARQLPAVGDWVLIEPAVDGPATVLEILPRRTQFVRRKAGTESAEQVIAANVDTVFIVSSLNQELNARRIERYLVATWDSGATPVVVLTKSDACNNIEAGAGPIRDAAAGAPVEVVSSVTPGGLDSLRKWLHPKRTVALIGSSGVGKSTLVNTLAGKELLTTQEIRDGDDKGRHTTTHREIFRLPDGVLLLDTPGMREFGLVEAEGGLEETFDDVAELARGCKFRDCHHVAEPGCAVRVAIEDGSLSPKRWESYERLQREAAYEERRADVGLEIAERKKWKQIHKDMRKMPKKG